MSRYIVVGAGIIGMSIASRLASFSQSVTIIDQTELAPWHGSSRSWVFLNPLAARRRSIGSLVLASMRTTFAEPPRYFGELCRPAGVIQIGSRNDLERVAELYFQGEGMGLDVQLIDKERLMSKFPFLNPDHAYAAVALPPLEGQEIDTHRLYEGMRKRLIHCGGEVRLGHELLEADRSGGEWRVRTSQGEIAGSVLINATGAWGNETALRCGVPPIGLEAKNRTMVIGYLDPAGHAPPLTRTPVLSWLGANEGLVTRVDPSGEIWWSPADDIDAPPGDVAANDEDVALAIDRLERQTTYRIRLHVTRRWAGQRTFTTSGDPRIGWDPRSVSFFWAVGFGGLGVECAPAAARLVADLVQGVKRDRVLYDDFGIRPSDFETTG